MSNNQYSSYLIHGHSILSGKRIKIGRIQECGKGFLPQVQGLNSWYSVGSAQSTYDEAVDFLFAHHYEVGRKKRGWTDEEFQKQVLKVQEKNLELAAKEAAERLQKQKQRLASLSKRSPN